MRQKRHNFCCGAQCQRKRMQLDAAFLSLALARRRLVVVLCKTKEGLARTDILSNRVWRRKKIRREKKNRREMDVCLRETFIRSGTARPSKSE